MTKGAAMQEFFSSFGLTAYPVTSVPDDAVMPYLTYTPYIGAWEDVAALTCELWYYSDSEAVPNAKVQEISDAIGIGGMLIPCDGGGIWITRGAPFAQALRDEVSENVRRRLINLNAEFLTKN